MSADALSLVFTGHMVDLPGRSSPRFSPEDAVRVEVIARHTHGLKKTDVQRGGDILFHEICQSFGFDTVIVLLLQIALWDGGESRPSTESLPTRSSRSCGIRPSPRDVPHSTP
jgi:hypothetical protein